jgi:hypothetical protein
MKVRILTFLIGISLNSFAQDQMLFDNIWILQDLVLDSGSHLPPNNEEITYVTLDFDSFVYESIEYFNLFGTTCETIGGLIEFDDTSNNFSFSEGPYETLGGGCIQSQNSNYEGIYFGFFYDNYNNGNIFDYSITVNNDESKTLIITSFNGNQAIYGSEVLSIGHNEKFDISLFYNAQNSSVEINSEKHMGRISIKIFNTLGRQVLQLHQNNKEKISINLLNVTDGIYFVSLQNEIGQIISKKIIKY